MRQLRLFGSVSGGDFAAAIAAGNPVIGKANSSHPGTTRIFAEEAQAAADDTQMPAGIVQLLYRTGHADGERLVSDPRVGATGYTGSRSAGLALKAAADAETRGWKISAEKTNWYTDQLKQKGMTIEKPSEQLTADMRKVGNVMLAEWLRKAGADGKKIIDQYRAMQ